MESIVRWRAESQTGIYVVVFTSTVEHHHDLHLINKTTSHFSTPLPK